MKLIVYLVFYGGVDHSDVRKQTGFFRKGFARHEMRNLEIWREALVEEANFSGWNTKEIGKLVKLHKHSSSIVQLWKGVKHLRHLKSIDCTESKKLTDTPDCEP
nr:hypothetical protein [Tanacetum cinerariifolium]